MKYSLAYSALENELLPPDLLVLLNGWRRTTRPEAIPALIAANLAVDVPLIREAAVRLAPLPSHLLEQALADKDARVRAAAVDMNTLSKEQLATALRDQHYLVRRAAVAHGALDQTQMEVALGDSDYLVRWAALEAGHVPTMFLAYLCGDPSWQVRAGALTTAFETGRLSKQLLDKATKTYHPLVNKIATNLSRYNVKNRPLAIAGLTSYRYFTGHSHIMIGARDHDDAMNEARRSTQDVNPENLEVWDGHAYVAAYPSADDTDTDSSSPSTAPGA